jgi:fused signal recognition particle receptor
MSLFRKLVSALKAGSISKEDWEVIRQQLIATDLGVNLVDQVIEKSKSIKSDNAVDIISTQVQSWLSDKSRQLAGDKNSTKTILVVGVNGTGKTTSVAKLANYLVNNGKSVLLAAADTFRAAATDQLQTWARRINIEVISGSENSDPAAVAFNAITMAKAKNMDYLIIDTAGRLHTKQNLMDELGKVVRVIKKQSTVDEILLVIDAMTGQNGLNQANVFIEEVGVTGFIVTKIDGSAKGGVALAIEKSSGIPIKFIGSGEELEDFKLFDPSTYIAGLFE